MSKIPKDFVNRQGAKISKGFKRLSQRPESPFG